MTFHIIKLVGNKQKRENHVDLLKTSSKPNSNKKARLKERLSFLQKMVGDCDPHPLLSACSDPVDAIRHQMLKKGMKQKDLVSILGGKNRVSEVLARRRPLTLPMIRKLYQQLDIPAELLIREIRPLGSVPTGRTLGKPT